MSNIEKLKKLVEKDGTVSAVYGCVLDDGLVTVMAAPKKSVENHKATGEPMIDAIYYVYDPENNKAFEMYQTEKFRSAFISAMDKRGVTF